VETGVPGVKPPGSPVGGRKMPPDRTKAAASLTELELPYIG